VIIQCPYCATRFQLDESRLGGPHPMLKCSRCRHIFPGPGGTAAGAKPSPTANPTASGRKGAGGTPQSLSFTFSDPPPKEPQEEFSIDEPEQEFELGVEPAEIMPVPTTTPRPTAKESAAEKQPDLFVADPGEEPESEAAAEAPPPAPPPAAAKPKEPEPSPSFGKDEFDAEAFDDEELEEEAVSPRGISVRPVLIFLGVIVLAYGVLSSTLHGDPVLADSLLRKLPFLSGLSEDRLLNRKIVLSEVTGGYQRIKDGDSVFVITGRALNNAPVTVHNVQIVGRLFDADNRPVEEKSIVCGNVVSTKILRSLTRREVSILQDLKPPKRFGIAPGEEASFVIVFMQPPKGVTEFTSQVIGAQRQA